MNPVDRVLALQPHGLGASLIAAAQQLARTMQRTVYINDKPVVFVSQFATDGQALAFLRSITGHDFFARNLIARRTHTPLTSAWLHKIATDHYLRQQQIRIDT